MYTPSPSILKQYADVLVKFALNSGEGVKPGEVVYVSVPECAKPFYVPLRTSILEVGAYPIMQFIPDDVAVADMYQQMNDEQITFFADKYYRGIVDQIDHSLMILAEFDKYELKDVPPDKLVRRQMAMKPYREWREQKEQAGKFTWTLALYGTPAMAKEVGLTEEEYWQQIIAACYLDDVDPIGRWKATQEELERVRGALNDLQIEKVHMEGPDVDLTVGLGPDRTWLGGSGRNIPSFELFISPDWRKTEGKITFNQPLYTHGQCIRGISLTFKDGLVTEMSATEGQPFLEEMIKVEGANRIGEFSLTDGRLSRITKPMGETLFDENMGGPEGNTHIAIGSAYKDSYPGDSSHLTKEDWDRLGYNESVVHTDIISTAPRKVTATLPSGEKRVIYEGGKFLI
ncbi:MAG: aminopeptidase [Candidatus Paceibacterota bacterium]